MAGAISRVHGANSSAQFVLFHFLLCGWNKCSVDINDHPREGVICFVSGTAHFTLVSETSGRPPELCVNTERTSGRDCPNIIHRRERRAR